MNDEQSLFLFNQNLNLPEQVLGRYLLLHLACILVVIKSMRGDVCHLQRFCRLLHIPEQTQAVLHMLVVGFVYLIFPI